jgi:agmatinase
LDQSSRISLFQRKDAAMDMRPLSRNMPERMDLPFVGLATFAGQPACTDWDRLDGADVAILGIPIDTASSYRVGTRFGPRAIREMSMFHGFGPEGVFDFEDEVTYLTADEVKIVDAGDSEVIYADTKRSLANAELTVRALLDAKAMPYILGGDHAITMATIAAYSNEKPIHIVHLDAHFDFIDARNGIAWGHGSPMRRASEMAHVNGITTLGPHNMAAFSKNDYEAAKAAGALAKFADDKLQPSQLHHQSFLSSRSSKSIGPDEEADLHGPVGSPGLQATSGN